MNTIISRPTAALLWHDVLVYTWRISYILIFCKPEESDVAIMCHIRLNMKKPSHCQSWEENKFIRGNPCFHVSMDDDKQLLLTMNLYFGV